MQVRAKVTHIQPVTQTYRTEGEVFSHPGKLYKHVEPVEGEKKKSEEADREK
jgi:hypothetical protein